MSRRYVGVDVDQFLSTPDTAKCTVVSAEKNLTKAVSDAIQRVNAKTDKGGTISLDITTDSVGLSPFHDSASMITPAIQAKIDAAIKGLKDGSIKACVETPFGAREDVGDAPLAVRSTADHGVAMRPNTMRRAARWECTWDWMCTASAAASGSPGDPS